MAYDGRLLRLAQERYEADRTRREAELAAQREEIYARRPRLREIQEQLRRTASRVMAAALRRGHRVPGRRAVPLPEDLLCGGAAPGAFPSAGFGRAEL